MACGAKRRVGARGNGRWWELRFEERWLDSDITIGSSRISLSVRMIGSNVKKVGNVLA